MDMPIQSLSSEKTLEEKLYECVEELQKRKFSCSLGAATEPARMVFPVGSPTGGNGASQKHHQSVFKCNAPRASNEKMGPRQGPIGKQRQQRQTSKGNIKVYPADPSNFKALVYEHTCKLLSSPLPDVATQPSSPPTPHSITSTLSALGFTSQSSSPRTPHSIPSSSTSPLSSPHQGPGQSVNLCYPPFKAHTQHRPPSNTHLNVPHRLPLLCNDNQNLIADHNTGIYQPTHVPQSASMPCLETSTEVDNFPFDDGRPHGLDPAMYARALSLRRFLLDDDAVCNENCM